MTHHLDGQQLSLLPPPEFEIRHEKIYYGSGTLTQRGWEHWYVVYRHGKFHTKFLRQDTAIAYVKKYPRDNTNVRPA